MGDLFKSLSSGLARFVYAWILPSALTCGVFSAVAVAQWVGESDVNLWMGGALFALATMSLSVTFAYASRAIFRFFEGITMPRRLANRLRRKQVKRYQRLLQLSLSAVPSISQESAEQLKGYPEDQALIMPTRLGNALKAMESYGVTRYGLDSQTFWYELNAAAPESVKLAMRETRAGVDFFISSLAHLILLVLACLASAATVPSPAPVVLTGLASSILAILSYRQACANVLEWRWSVQALVNTSRETLANSMGLKLPTTMQSEILMWQTLSGFTHYGQNDDYLSVLNGHRQQGATLASNNASMLQVTSPDPHGPDADDSRPPE